jgi:hypothetical protein
MHVSTRPGSTQRWCSSQVELGCTQAAPVSSQQHLHTGPVAAPGSTQQWHTCQVKLGPVHTGQAELGPVHTLRPGPSHKQGILQSYECMQPPESVIRVSESCSADAPSSGHQQAPRSSASILLRAACCVLRAAATPDRALAELCGRCTHAAAISTTALTAGQVVRAVQPGSAAGTGQARWLPSSAADGRWQNATRPALPCHRHWWPSGPSTRARPGSSMPCHAWHVPQCAHSTLGTAQHTLCLASAAAQHCACTAVTRQHFKGRLYLPPQPRCVLQ